MPKYIISLNLSFQMNIGLTPGMVLSSDAIKAIVERQFKDSPANTLRLMQQHGFDLQAVQVDAVVPL